MAARQRDRAPGSAAPGVSPAVSRPGRAAQPATVPRRPPHPGQFLQTRFLTPLDINQTELASALGISRRRVNELIRGHRAITPDTALRLGLYFGNDAMFWMQLQTAWDLHEARQRMRALPRA